MPPEPPMLTPADQTVTAESIVACQQRDGLIPWFEGGHGDPWNHVEAAMALATAGFRAEAERAYTWMVDRQRADGSWHQYYRGAEVEQDKLDANVIAYVATGVWHHHLLFGDAGFADTMWPVVARAVDFVLDLQTARGEILWARHPDGTAWPFALLTGSSSISHSLRCALALAAEIGDERPDWELSLGRLAHTIRHEPEAFAPKHRWAMDWYYPVLTGVIEGTDGSDRLRAREDTFVIEGEGVRCVSDRPWITTAETAECAVAHLATGDRDRAVRLFGWAQQLRDEGRYATGWVLPDRAEFPPAERSTYSAAAMILAADAIDGSTPAAPLFADPDFLPAILVTDPADEPARD